MVNVFVLQLMCVLLQSQVYTVMNTAAYNKFCMEVEMLHPKLSLSVSLLDTINLNLYEEEVDKKQVDQTHPCIYFTPTQYFSPSPTAGTNILPHQ